MLFVLAWVAWVVCLLGSHASVGGMGGVLAWVAYLRVWRASVCSVGGMGACVRRWRASVGIMLLLLLSLLLRKC